MDLSKFSLNIYIAVVEVDTPYIVKVELLKKEYKKVLASDKTPGRIQEKAPIDTGVLSYIFNTVRMYVKVTLRCFVTTHNGRES